MFLVLIWGFVDGITQWNTETIRQQWQFSNVPPASIWRVQISISVIWPLAQNYGFFAFVVLRAVWFALEGSGEAWGAALCWLRLVWTLTLPLWTCTHFQYALVASWPCLLFPASPRASVRPFQERSPSALSLFFPQSVSPNRLSVQLQECQLCLRRNSK